MRDIIIVQHCQSEHHINGLAGGWTDTPLTEHGRFQAITVVEQLQCIVKGKSFCIYSSDLIRASQTADIIAERTGFSLTLISGIREGNNGIAAGKTKEWEKANVISPPKENSIDFVPFEGAETCREFFNRTVNALEDIQQKNEENIILVTYGGTISNIIAWWMRIPVEVLASSRFFGSPGGISRLGEDIHGTRFVSFFNDVHHLCPF